MPNAPLHSLPPVGQNQKAVLTNALESDVALTFNDLSFVVSDMRRALEFYRLLGLPIPAGALLNAAGESEDYLRVSQGGQRIAWETEGLMRQLDPAWTRPAGQGVGMALLADNPAEIDGACERVQGDGHSVLTAPWDALWGQHSTTVLDPDGYRLDVFAWLPGQPT